MGVTAPLIGSSQDPHSEESHLDNSEPLKVGAWSTSGSPLPTHPPIVSHVSEEWVLEITIVPASIVYSIWRLVVIWTPPRSTSGCSSSFFVYSPLCLDNLLSWPLFTSVHCSHGAWLSSISCFHPDLNVDLLPSILTPCWRTIATWAPPVSKIRNFVIQKLLPFNFQKDEDWKSIENSAAQHNLKSAMSDSWVSRHLKFLIQYIFIQHYGWHFIKNENGLSIL